MRYILIFFATCLIVLCLSGQNSAIADDPLDVERGNDKTVYTVGATDAANNSLGARSDKEKNAYSIGSGKERRNEEARKEERSWDMLMNMNIWQENPQDKQHDRDHPPKDRPQKNQPAKGRPAQLPAAQ
jgi:hypothetical protein